MGNIYLYGAMTLLIVGYVSYSEIERANLKAEISTLKNERISSDFNLKSCKAVIEDTNNRMALANSKIIESQKQLELWKSKPAKIKYETIYRDVIIDNHLTGECDEIKTLIDNTTNSVIDSL